MTYLTYIFLNSLMSKLSQPLYKIVKKVGQGAMSEVFLATKDNGQNVAIKILRSFLKDHEKYKTRLEQEGRILSQMDNEHIVKPLGTYSTEDGRLALVQEFVEGKNIDEILLQFSSTEFCHPIIGAIIVSEILLGIEEAHRQGIIHRDLKPENIMITHQGKIKITDFGVAKNLESEELTTTGMILGSPAYMSPEQALGKRVEESSDLFSLGILLYRFATGRLPFKGESYASLIQNIINTNPPSAENINCHIHPEFKKILVKSLEKDPHKRYQKAYTFRYDLMRFLDHVGAPSPKKALIFFYQGNLEELKFWEGKNLVNTLIGRAQTNWDLGKSEEGLLLLKQAMEIDPQNLEIKKLFKEKLRGQKNSKMIFPFLILVSLFFVGIPSYFYYSQRANFRVEAVAHPLASPLPPTDTANILSHSVETNFPTPTNDEKPKALNQLGKQNHNIQKQKKNLDEINLKASAIEKPRNFGNSVTKRKILEDSITAKGKVRFNVNDDVWVYLDGKRIENLNTPTELKAGIHEIELLRPGYGPIKSTILVKEGETTVINSKTQ